MTLSLHLFPSAVTIGFEDTTYTVIEGDDVSVCVNLIDGQLAPDRTVMVTVATDDILGSGALPSKCFRIDYFNYDTYNVCCCPEQQHNYTLFYMARSIFQKFFFYPTVNIDFVSLSMELIFSNATTTHCVTISTVFIADVAAMPFNVNLTTSTPAAVSLNPAFTTVNIQDGK